MFALSQITKFYRNEREIKATDARRDGAEERGVHGRTSQRRGHRATKQTTLLATLLLGAVLSGCNGGSKPNIELIQDMMESPANKAQDFYLYDREKSTMLVPPEHTVPRGFEPYPYPQDPELAEKNLNNPYVNKADLLAKGKTKFETYCAVCHGEKGMGDGPVSAKMAVKPPSLMSDKVRKFRDGRIFHIITMGQGVMGSYATQITDREDRWAVVNYIRSMQKNGG